MFDPAEEINRLATEKIEAFCGTINDDGRYKDRIYKSAKRFSNQVADDYNRRFLIELIQNGYDAQPKGTTEGQIRIVVAPDEGSHGTVYVANSGRPFERSNVDALCDIALSDKPIGQTVGNKGLGFRSVSYITDDPQIFSQSDTDLKDRFYGFCFRFASETDIDRLIDDPIRRDKAKNDLPPFRIPIPIETQSERIRQLASDGFVTTIRLPLKSQASLEVVYKEIDKLRDSHAPVMLFLEKLTKLEIRVEADPSRSFLLTRSAQPIFYDAGSGENADRLYRVSLGDSGTYFVAAHKVAELDVKAAIAESIQKGQLHEEWEDWSGDGDVAIAIRIDGSTVTPTLYTYLPMDAEARSPFYGFLNASFFVKLDRRRLDADIVLNSLYFANAVRLCARTIVAILDSRERLESFLSKSEIRSLIVDLLAWDDSFKIQGVGASTAPLVNAFKTLGHELKSLRVLPVINVDETKAWSTPINTWQWNHTKLSFFTAERLATDAKAEILDPTLGTLRLERIVAFLERLLGRKPYPLPVQLAASVEKLAATLRDSDASTEQWQEFYMELEKLFPFNTGVLTGRRLLLCNDGNLRAAPAQDEQQDEEGTHQNATPDAQSAGRKSTVSKVIFLPPRGVSAHGGGLSETINRVPKSLLRGIAFLDERLNWYTDKMQGARSFLEKAKLVRNYDADELIGHVSRTLRSTTSDTLLRQGLAWVFDLYRTSKRTSRPISITRARLKVPTLTGKWIPARDAAFSAGWPINTLGPTLSNFLSQVEATSDDLRDISSRLLASPSAPPFSKASAEEWAAFLTEIGVQSGLVPIRKETRQMRIQGYLFNTDSLGSRLNLGEETISLWQQAVKGEGGLPQYSSSQHELKGSIWYLPGQNEYMHWSMQARITYSELILHWLKSAKDTHFATGFFVSSYPYHSLFHWPTPLAAFLRRVAWLPLRMPKHLTNPTRFEKPSNVWLYDEEKWDRPPVFLPLVHPNLRKIIQRAPELTGQLRKLCRANVWDAKETLARQVGYLGELYQEVGVEPYYLRTFLNTYHKSWEALAVEDASAKQEVGECINYVITERGGEYESIKVKQSRAPAEADTSQVFVRDTDDNLAVSLVKTLDLNVFDIDSVRAPQIASLLKRILGPKYQEISTLQLEVLVDGRPFKGQEIKGVDIVKASPLLPTLVLIAAECLSGLEAQRLPADRMDLIGRLNNIDIYIASKVSFNICGQVTELPESLYGAISILDEPRSAIIVESASDYIGWNELALAAKPISSLLRQLPLAQPLKNAFRTLQRRGHTTDSIHFDFDELAAELGVDKQRAHYAVKSLRRDVSKVCRFLRPVIHYYAGESAVESFNQRVEKVETTEHLTPILESLLATPDMPYEALIERCEKADTLPDLRDTLSLEFAKFNRALIAVGEEPDTDPTAHKNALLSYIELHRSEVMDCIRHPFIPLFQQTGDLSDYVRQREELYQLQPDERWFVDYRIPTEALLADHINQWLTTNGASPLTSSVRLLPPADEVTRDNKRTVDKFISTSYPIVRAWCEKNNVPIPVSWQDLSSAKSRIATALHGAGALDFISLDDSMIISWLRKINTWPTGMPPSTKPDDLGIKPNDLNESNQRNRRLREEYERKRRSVEFGSELIDPDNFDAELVSKQVRDKVAQIQTAPKVGRPTNLSVVTGGRGSGPNRGGGGGSWRGRELIPPQKKELIGFLGECVVYHWLRRQFPDRDIDRAWVSKNRTKLLVGDGDDTLGYDFEIRYLNKTWFLEVKASTGDPLAFELGETEVRRARDCAKTKREEYYIIYVSNIHNPAQVKIEQLPNPMSDVHAKHYKLVGEGLKYKFSRP